MTKMWMRRKKNTQNKRGQRIINMQPRNTPPRPLPLPLSPHTKAGYLAHKSLSIATYNQESFLLVSEDDPGKLPLCGCADCTLVKAGL